MTSPTTRRDGRRWSNGRRSQAARRERDRAHPVDCTIDPHGAWDAPRAQRFAARVAVADQWEYSHRARIALEGDRVVGNMSRKSKTRWQPSAAVCCVAGGRSATTSRCRRSPRSCSRNQTCFGEHDRLRARTPRRRRRAPLCRELVRPTGPARSAGVRDRRAPPHRRGPTGARRSGGGTDRRRGRGDSREGAGGDGPSERASSSQSGAGTSRVPCASATSRSWRARGASLPSWPCARG